MKIKKKELINLFYILDKMNMGDLTANHASLFSKEKKGFLKGSNVDDDSKIFFLISLNLFKEILLGSTPKIEPY